MNLILIVVAVIAFLIISNQYANLKKMDNIQRSLDKINENLEKMVIREKND